jgi:hypothetical protein
MGSVSSMYRILKSTGFKFRKTNYGSKFHTARGDIVSPLFKFLRAVHNFRISGDQNRESYSDETWGNRNHSKNTFGMTHEEREA